MPPAEYEQQYYLEIAGYAMGSTTASSDAHRKNCDKAEGGELEHRLPRRDVENAQRIRLRCGTGLVAACSPIGWIAPFSFGMALARYAAYGR